MSGDILIKSIDGERVVHIDMMNLEEFGVEYLGIGDADDTSVIATMTDGNVILIDTFATFEGAKRGMADICEAMSKDKEYIALSEDEEDEDS